MAKPADGMRRWGYLIAFAVILFVIAMIAVQLGYPCINGQCYNVLTNPISDLGNTMTSTLWPIFNYSIVLFGVLVIVGILGIRRLFIGSRAGALGVSLIIIAMFGAMGVGVVPENTVLAIHSIFALFAFGLGGPAAILIGYHMLHSRKRYAWFSIVMGALTLIAFCVFVAPQFGIIPAWQIAGGAFGFGGAERLIAAPVLLWLLVTGVYPVKPRRQ